MNLVSNPRDNVPSVFCSSNTRLPSAVEEQWPGRQLGEEGVDRKHQRKGQEAAEDGTDLAGVWQPCSSQADTAPGVRRVQSRRVLEY